MDDIAGQYSDHQDRQEKSNRTIEESIEDSIVAWLDQFIDDEFNMWFTHDASHATARGLVQALAKDGFEITVRKEVKT